MFIYNILKNLLSYPLANVIPSSGLSGSMIIGLGGDSTAEQMITLYDRAGADAFETQGANYVGTTTAYDAARSGSFLLQTAALAVDAGNTNLIWVNNATAPFTASSQLTSNVTNDTNNPDSYLFSLGVNDNSEIVNEGVTASDVEDAYDLIAATASTPFIVLETLGRDLGGDDEGCNIIRQGQLDAISNNTAIKRAADTYDLSQSNNKHPTESAYEIKGIRGAIQCGFHLGYTTTQALGPEITGAVLKTDMIDLTLSHVGGTDIVAPTAGNGGLDAEDDGTAMSANALTRLSATSARLDFPEGKGPSVGSTVKLFTPYGRGSGLGLTPDVMRDNSSLQLPLQSSIITVTQGNPIMSLDNIIAYYSVRGGAKTITSGEFTSLEGIAGALTTMDEASVDDHATWDATALNGKGGLKLATTTRMKYGLFSSSDTHTIIAVFQAPETVLQSSLNLMGWSNSLYSSSNTARWVTAADKKLYVSTTSGSFAVTDTLVNGGKYLVMYEFTSGNCNAYMNDFSTPFATFNPGTSYANRVGFYLGSRSPADDALAGAAFGELIHVSDGLTSQEKADIFNYLNSYYSLGL